MQTTHPPTPSVSRNARRDADEALRLPVDLGEVARFFLPLLAILLAAFALHAWLRSLDAQARSAPAVPVAHAE
jgi:hypothetical protein